MKRVFENIDGVSFTFNSASDFINWTQKIWKENEASDTHLTLPTTVDECDFYLTEYCDNLTFIEGSISEITN